MGGMTTLMSATPALPVRDVPSAVTFYREKLGFSAVHVDGGFAVLRRDGVEINLWEANSPTTPGAEPHLAGSGSCRVRVTGLRDLYAELQGTGVIHPNGSLSSQWWGVDDFATLDLDDNLIGSYEPTAAPANDSQPGHNAPRQ